MAKGGYKGSSPARETSPEEYSGVWDIVEQYGEQKTGNWPFQETDCAPKSLRFDGSSSYLSKTPSQAGNKRTWTFSFWVKRCNVGNATQVIWMAYNSAIDEANYATISFTGTGQLRVGWAYDTYKTTTAQYRDPSAWMHCCISVDTNHAVASERVQVAINGVKQTEFAGSHDPDLGQQLAWNGAYLHHLGSEASQQYSHNYLSEIQFVDGQQLSCEEFGFFNGQGIWSPKRFTGDYSSGPVYSNSSVISSGGSASSYPLHQGFNGDLSNRFEGDTSGAHVDIPYEATVSSGSVEVYAAVTSSQPVVVTLFNGSSQVGTGSSGASGSQWHAPTTYAGPITKIRISRTGRAPEFNAVRVNGTFLTDASVGRNSFHLDFSDGVKDQSGLGNDWTGNNVGISGDGPASSPVWESGDSGWTIASGGGSASEGGSNGYQDVFTGLMEVGKVYAFTTSHNDGDQNGGWFFADSNSTSLSGTHPNQGRGSNSIGQRGRSSGHSDENNAGAHGTFATANGVTAGDSNLSGFSIINPEGSDTINWVVDRVVNKVWVKRSTDSAWIQGGNPSDAESSPSFHLPATGDLYFGFVQYNNSNLTISIAAYSFTASGRASDIFVDSPVNGNEASTGAGGERRGNYATLNPIAFTNLSLVDGNSQTSGGGSQWLSAFSTIKTPESGKWFYECTPLGGNNGIIGIFKDLPNTNTYIGDQKESYGWYGSTGNTSKGPGNTQVSYNSGATFSTNDVIGVALDLDAGTLTFYKNGASQGVAFSGLSGSFFFAVSRYNGDMKVNFGQRPFKHPVSGFSPLATSFLPEPSEVAKHPHKGVDVALFNANNGVSLSIPLSFSPDLVWTKSRAQNYEPQIFDKVRGDNQEMSTNVARASRNLANSFVFNDDGFTLPSSNNNANYGTGASVAWAWDAGEATTSIAAGGLNTSAYNQTQTWSGNISTTGNSGTFHSSYPATNAFNNNDTNYAHGNGDGSQTAVVTLTLSPGVSCSNTVTLLGGMTGSGTATISVNGGTAVNLTSGSGATTKTNVSFSGTVTSIVITKTSSDASGMLIYGFEIDGTRLVDNGVSVDNVPSIATTVRANPSYGFSISRASVNASLTGGPTVAHGLQKKPEFIIGKNIDYTIYWYAYHKDLTNEHYLIPHLTSGEQNSGAVWGNHDSLDHNKIQIGSDTPASMWIPSGTDDCIFYAWTSVEGFSKFGSFMNPSSTNGGFVYLGFKPALIFAKCAVNISSTNNLGDWIVKDSSRSPFNNPSDGNTLVWNEAYSEDGYYSASQAAIDILSNGFKIRHPNSSPLGDPGRLYVFAAWAENPFASNNRAV